MKKYALPVALVSVLGLQACNEAQEPAANTEKAASTEVALDTTAQRLSYGIAFGLGKRMESDAMPIDVDAFAAGLRDATTGAEPRLTQEEIQTEMQAYQEKAVAEQQAAQAAVAGVNLAAAEAFLAENAQAEGVIVTDSGLQYTIVEEGEGALPQDNDTVEVHYRGTLLDGTEFDSSYARGETISFGVGQVIPGWTEALKMMPVGSKWKLFIPPSLAYGAGGAGEVIEPNSALVFDVELIGINEPEAPAEDAAE